MQQHNLPKALELTHSLVEAFPDEYEAHVMRVHALYEAIAVSGRLERTLLEDAVNALARVDPAAPLLELVRIWLALDQDHAARFDKLLARDDLTPASRSWVLRNRVLILVGTDNTSRALPAMEEARRLDPANPHNYAILSTTLRKAERFDEAITRARQAIALDPYLPRFRFRLAEALEATGRWDEALREYKMVCQLREDQGVWAHYVRALQRSGRQTAAADAARIATTKLETGQGSYDLAGFWAQYGDRAEAVRLIQRSLELGHVPSDIGDDEDLASLHGDPEFEAIVAEVKRLAGED